MNHYIIWNVITIILLCILILLQHRDLIVVNKPLGRIENFKNQEIIHPNQVFDCIFVINLDRRADRMQTLHPILHNLGIKYTRFSAIDGSKYMDLYRKLSKNNTTINSPGSVGILLTYQKLLKKINREKYNRILILEDDVRFHRNFLNLFHQNMKILTSHDLVYLGANQQKWNNIHTHPEKTYYTIPSNASYPFGAFAISLNKKIITYLINQLSNTWKYPIDWYIGKLHYNSQFKSCVLYPNLIIADVTESDNMGNRDLQLFATKAKWDLNNYKI